MIRRAATALTLAALGVALAASSAAAHAIPVSSDPRAGAQLDVSPASVTIVFSEEPELAFSSMQVLDAGGIAVHQGEAEPVPGEPRTLRVGVRPDLDDGVYTVVWRVLSQVDGHTTGGAFAFGVRVDPTDAPLAVAPEIEEPAPQPLEIAGRWGLFAGLGLLLGAAWVGASAFAAAPGGIWRITAWAWGASVVGLVLLAEAQRRSAGATIGALLGTSIGGALIWRAVAIGLAGIALLVARASSGRARSGGLWAVGTAAAAAMLVHVSAGHAASGERVWANVVGQWVHFGAVGVWLGGLAALLAGLGGQEPEVRARAVRRFSTVAGVALLVVLASGVARSLDELPDLASLWEHWYGRVILIKVVLLAGLAGLGVVNRYRSVPEASAGSVGRLQRVSRGELVIAAFALVAAAALATISPPYADARAPGLAGPVVVEGADFASTMRVEVEIDPGFPGANSFRARVTSFGSGDAIEGALVRLRFSFPDDPIGEPELTLTENASGVYEGSGGQMGIDGLWRIVVLVQRAADSREIRLTTATRCRTQAIPVPDQPTLHDVVLREGMSAQSYASPGRSGGNEIHVTYFDAEGRELSVEDEPRFTALSRDDGEVTELTVRRFGPGHFIGDARLEPGVHRFDMVAVAADGLPVRACFEETITE